MVHPADHPEDRKEVRLPDPDAESWMLQWAPTEGTPRYIDRISILGPRLSLGTGEGTVLRRAPSSARLGRWYTVRVQVFPDGRCGLAIDGNPVDVVEGPVPLDRRYRLDISGKSVGTRILVGPVEVWQGVKGGVDWLSLEPLHH